MANDRPKDLNDKQKLFVAEYLKDLNATQAAGYVPAMARKRPMPRAIAC